MNRQTYGLLSILLILATIFTATYAILQSSVIWTVIYLVGILLSALVDRKSVV